MGDSAITGATEPSRRLTLTLLAVWALLAFALPLSALTLNALNVAGFPLGFWMAAQGSLLALAALALVFAGRAGGRRCQEGYGPAVRMAGEMVTSAGFIGFGGLIAAMGFDGLAYPLGIAAGLALIAIFIAPRFALYPSSTFAGFFTARYGGVWPRRLALLIAAVSAVLILAADLRGAGFAIQGLIATGYATAAAIAAVLLSLIWLACPLVAGRLPKGGAYWIMLLAFLAALVALAVAQGRLPLPHLIYGLALKDVTSLEQKLLEMKLADVNALRPLVAPFLKLSMVNFAGIVLGLALGLAALPHLLGRHLAQGVVVPGDAPRRAARALALVVLFLVGIAAFSVLGRAAIAGLLITGVKTSALPQAVVQASGLGWIEVCEAQSFSAADLAAACSKLSGQKGLLRLQDLTFGTDGFLYAVSWIAGIPAPVWAALLAGGLLAALVSGHAILNGMMSALGEGAGGGSNEGRGGFGVRSAVAAGVLLLAALAVATHSSLNIAALTSEGLSLIASGLFPALALGLYWRRFSAPGAVAAMAAGFVIAGLYIASVRLFPALMFDLTGSLSTAPPTAVRKFAALKAALAAAGDEVAREAARIVLVRHAEGIANWWGLKPGAAALLGVPAGLIAGVCATVLQGRGRAAP